MSICDKCKNKTYVIYITTKHEKVCPECYDKIRKLKGNKNDKYMRGVSK